MKDMRKFLLNLLLLLGVVGVAGAQTITTTSHSVAEDADPFVGGSTNVVVFSFTVSKTGAATNLTEVTLNTGAVTDPNVVFSSVQLLQRATLGAATSTGTPQINAT